MRARRGQGAENRARHRLRLSPAGCGYVRVMATAKQKKAARHNLEKARSAPMAKTGGGRAPASSTGMSTEEKDRLEDQEFAFPEQRKEPLVDAGHVRNAVARFNQVEGVSDEERDRAWARIRKAARKHDVELSESDWRELAKGGKTA